MNALWFALASVLLAGYVILDGFDFGAGALHLMVAKTDRERREVLAAIGPFWDGNEVWLLAAGGVLFLAFPKVLGSGLSGLYLPVFFLLWALILRGIAIEFRSHVEDPMWRRFWDAIFCLASALPPVLLGAALGNLLRGVPLDASGYFALPLWTDFSITAPFGVLDGYTTLAGVLALVALAHHGALFLAWKTEGQVHEKSLRAAKRLFFPLVALWLAATGATYALRPDLFQQLATRPLALIAALLGVAGLLGAALGRRRGRPLFAFVGSSAFLLGILGASAASSYPVMIPSTLNPALSLTALNAASSAESLRTGLLWWPFGFVLALGYLALLFHLHRGKVQSPAEGEGY
ncbi:MAG TPA: cytochrome d ubiquinol oxidase subunit II [Thermoanaerobaculia bacterium]|jgi:cytochrome d ubiquinol oxidase subunit II|nr:cytochrome d ubiquinol oxidase subunit II [Thermoanaerobaculia bacterium]